VREKKGVSEREKECVSEREKECVREREKECVSERERKKCKFASTMRDRQQTTDQGCAEAPDCCGEAFSSACVSASSHYSKTKQLVKQATTAKQNSLLATTAKQLVRLGNHAKKCVSFYCLGWAQQRKTRMPRLADCFQSKRSQKKHASRKQTDTHDRHTRRPARALTHTLIILHAFPIWS
jgi:hypothetical protein